LRNSRNRAPNMPLILILLCCARCSAVAMNTNNGTVDVTATLIVDKGTNQIFLDMAIANKTDKPLQVQKHSLPWEGFYSLLLLPVKADALGTLIEPPIYPCGIPPLIQVPVSIEPGATIKGRISLTKRFPALHDALRTKDVVLFWSYQLEPINSPPLQRTGGWLLLPKGTK
jgi:hypothetical protein